MITTGSCLCGEVQFAIDGEFERFYLCHCQYCRKDTGSAHAANVFSSAATLTWLSGRERVREFKLPGTRHVKSFCANCGSALPTAATAGPQVVVPAGSLDDTLSLRPTAHLFVASRAEWDKNLENIKKWEGLPE